MTQKKVLVVGPAPDLVSLVAESVDRGRYHVERRADPAHAMEYLSKHSAAAIVVDVDVDENRVETMQFIQTVRLLRRFRSAHIIAVSKKVDIDTLRETISAGADDYMSQPIHPSELSSRIKWAASMSSMQIQR